MITSATALSPLERAVLDAIYTTGQGDGRLHDVSAVARRIVRMDEAVNRAVRTLHAKGRLPRAGISEEALRDRCRKEGVEQAGRQQIR